MATVIKRRDGRIEIRENILTPHGPRSRTLAIGPELTDALLDHAVARASRPLDRDTVIERGARIGVHRVRTTQPDDVSSLSRRLRSGEIWPTHAQAIRTLLPETHADALPDHLEAMVEWMGADDDSRGRALVDLLKLSVAIMRHQAESRRVHAPLAFPSLRDCVRRR